MYPVYNNASPGLNLMLSELSERQIAVLGKVIGARAEKLQAGLRESFPLLT